MIKDIINDIVKQRQEAQEEIIKKAFLHHFGFPIDKVLHEGNLSREIMQNSTVQRFCYKGECFLLWDESDGLNVETGNNLWRGTLTAKYLFV